MGRRKKTHLDFVRDIEDKFGDRYTILGRFTDWRTKILVRCNICHNEWEIRPDALTKGKCPKCSRNKKSKSEEEFKSEIEKVHGDKYVFIGQYENYQNKVLMKCNICGNEWLVLPNNLISKKSGCPECSKKIVGEKQKLTHDEFVEKIEMNYPGKYTFLTQYIDSDTKILVRCNVDGYEWLTLPGSLYKGTCPKCGEKG